MTAKQLIAKASECVICGKEHKPFKTLSGGMSWASRTDGHAYRTRLFDLTNHSSGPVIAALRQLAGIS